MRICEHEGCQEPVGAGRSHWCFKHATMRRLEYQRRYYREHFEKAKAYQREYHQTHRRTTTVIRGRNSLGPCQRPLRTEPTLKNLHEAGGIKFEKLVQRLLRDV